MLDATQANSILTYMHGGGAPRALTGSRLRLMTVNGTASANGTEVATGGGYTAYSAGTPNPTVAGIALTWGAAAAQSQAISAVAQVTNYPRAETVVGIENWSTDATAGNRVELGALTGSKVMAAGDTLSFAASAVTSAIS